MTFASLKKSSPSASPKDVTVDEFIQDAENYARGLSKVVSLHPSEPGAVEGYVEPLKTTSVALTSEARATLDLLSTETGISRSRLMRIWLGGVDVEQEKALYLSSKIR